MRLPPLCRYLWAPLGLVLALTALTLSWRWQLYATSACIALVGFLVAERAYRRAVPPRRHRLALVAFCAAVTLGACALALLDRFRGHSVPRSPEEQEVARFILDNADDPSSVRFDRFGPNLINSPEAPPGHTFSFIRVRFRSKNSAGVLELTDWLVVFVDGKVYRVRPNLDGDEWPERSGVGSSRPPTSSR